MKKIGAIVLARMDSSRLPGKGLLNILDKQLLSYVIERVKNVEKVDNVILATTGRDVDDPLVKFADKTGISCYRGSVNDVAGRVKNCSNEYELDVFVRINGDSPLVDYAAINKGVEIFLRSNCDLVTNIFPRGYPVGASVEVVDVKTFNAAYANMRLKEHLEHVTKYFYDHPEQFFIYNIPSPNPSLRDIHLAVDTEADLCLIRKMFQSMHKHHLFYTGERLYHLYRQVIERKNELQGCCDDK